MDLVQKRAFFGFFLYHHPVHFKLSTLCKQHTVHFSFFKHIREKISRSALATIRGHARNFKQMPYIFFVQGTRAQSEWQCVPTHKLLKTAASKQMYRLARAKLRAHPSRLRMLLGQSLLSTPTPLSAHALPPPHQQPRIVLSPLCVIIISDFLCFDCREPAQPSCSSVCDCLLDCCA